MPTVFDANGLQLATQAEWVAYLTAGFQTIYGNDINLDSSTPDGQWMNLIVQAILDVQEVNLQTYTTIDPDNAIGVTLDQRVAINGIEREGGTFTVTNVTLVLSQSDNFFGLNQSDQPVYTVADNAGNQWQLISTVLGLPPGTHALAFRALLPGKVISIPNTITVPVTVSLAVSSINNPTTFTTLGVDEETDVALKVRRRNSVSLASQGYFAGLLGQLQNINGITSAFIHENDGSTADTDGVPGHSIWVIVAGTPDIPVTTTWASTVSYTYGQIVGSGGINYISWQKNNLGNNPSTSPGFWGVYNPVAQAIYSKRNAGCGMFGDTEYTVVKIDGTNFIVSYDTVVQEPLFIEFTASSIDGVNAPNIAAIQTELPINYAPGVFGEVNINQLATLVQEIDGNTLVTDEGFSTSLGGTYTNTLTPSSKKNQFQVSAANTVILPMILSAPMATATIVAGLVTHTNLALLTSQTAQFTGLGGHGSLSYTIDSGPGAIAGGGLFTPAGTGTTVVRVTDGLLNTTTCIVIVS